ncbi:sigma factor [Bradyrhizobium sp.]|uniref:sigma factor n=1 Tax=Bradyrhizobium sp. TaxID=376 RepID=UPI0039B99CF2
MQTDDDGNHDALAKISPAVVRALADAHDGIRRFLRRSLRNEDDADDVMQELYVRLLVRSSQLRQEESARA